MQVTSINQLSELLPNDDSGLMEFEDLTNNTKDQDLYEDLVFLARNNDILSEDAPNYSSHDETCTSEALTQQNTLLVYFKALIGLLSYMTRR